jgi:hypothetical protein
MTWTSVLSAQSALGRTKPQTGIEGVIRFEGWYSRKREIVEEEPLTYLVDALSVPKGTGDLRKPGTETIQIEDWSPRPEPAEQRYWKTPTDSKG